MVLSRYPDGHEPELCPGDTVAAQAPRLTALSKSEQALDGDGRGVLRFAARFRAGAGVAAGPRFNHRGR